MTPLKLVCHVAHALGSTEQRLARALVLLSGYPARHKSNNGGPTISQGLLAEVIGTSRSRVNRFMRRFLRLGLVKYDAGSGSGLQVRAPLARLMLQNGKGKAGPGGRRGVR